MVYEVDYPREVKNEPTYKWFPGIPTTAWEFEAHIWINFS